MLAFKTEVVLWGGGGRYQKPCQVFVVFPRASGRRKNRGGEKTPKVLSQKLEIVKMLGFCAN